MENKMKNIKNIFLTLFLTITLSGCFGSQLKYDDLKQTYDHSTRAVPEIYLKHIVEGDHTETIWWTDGIDTVWRPKGNEYIVQEDLVLLEREAETSDEKRQKGLLIHENAHCFLTRHKEMWRVTTRRQWYNEQFGYGAQIRYLVLADEFSEISDRANFVRYITDDAYDGMASTYEALSFVNWIVSKAKEEKNND
jgi:hypothetical protein